MYACFCQVEDCILCEAQLYNGLTSEQVCQVRGMLRKHTYGPREILFREGDASGHLLVLRGGQLKLTVSGTEGREQIIGLAVAGHLVGFDTMDDQTYTYTAETLTPVTACKIQHKDMLKVLEQNPGVLRRVVDILNKELAQAQSLIRVLGQKTSGEKVACFILSLVPAAAGAVGSGATYEFPLPLSRQEIAQMLGLTVETVSRHMSDLKREEIIEAPRGHLRILDLPRLKTLAGVASLNETGAGHAATLFPND